MIHIILWRQFLESMAFSWVICNGNKKLYVEIDIADLIQNNITETILVDNLFTICLSGIDIKRNKSCVAANRVETSNIPACDNARICSPAPQVVVLFAPIWGGSLGICSVCWMLCTALYGSTSLQQSSKGSCSLLVSGYNLWADWQWRTLVPPLNSGANAAPASVLALM